MIVVFDCSAKIQRDLVVLEEMGEPLKLHSVLRVYMIQVAQGRCERTDDKGVHDQTNEDARSGENDLVLFCFPQRGKIEKVLP